MACRGRSKSTAKTSTGVVSASSKDGEKDGWAFLELVDAPQWIDLSVEASLTEQEGDDPWFYHSHPHHQMSLQLPSQKTKEGRVVRLQGRSVLKARLERRGRVKNLGHEHPWPRSQVKRVQLRANSSPSQDDSSDRLSSEVLGCTPSSSGYEFDCEKLVLEEGKHKLSCSEISSGNRMPNNDSGTLICPIQEPGKGDASYCCSTSVNHQKSEDEEDFFHPMPGTLEQLSSHLNVLRLSSECLSAAISQSACHHKETSTLDGGCKSSDLGKLKKKVEMAGYEYRRILNGKLKKKSILSDRNIAETQKVHRDAFGDITCLSFRKGKSKNSIGAFNEKALFCDENQDPQIGSFIRRTQARSAQATHIKQADSGAKSLKTCAVTEKIGWTQTQGRLNSSNLSKLEAVPGPNSKDMNWGQSLIMRDLHGIQRKDKQCSMSTFMKQASPNILRVGVDKKSSQRMHSESLLGSNPELSHPAEDDLAALIAKHNLKVCLMPQQRYKGHSTLHKRIERHLR